ncbi:MAG TPA: cytochrome c-type biogenesis protein CcmH [Thermoleophilaceae bacterium]
MSRSESRGRAWPSRGRPWRGRIGGSRTAAAIALASLVLAAPAVACPRTTVADVEDEVMCPVCGTSLATSGDAPLAVQERRLVSQLVARCRTKSQIKDALAAEYGDAVLAVPKQEGFGLTTYLVPALALLLAAAAVVGTALRWRRRRPQEAAATAGPKKPDPADAARLEADLRSYDL